MTSAVTITLRASGATPAGLSNAAVARVRPENGRMIERLLRLDATEIVAVAAGNVEVDVELASGQLMTRSLHVAEDERAALQFDFPSSPHETMGWLNLTRSGAAPPSASLGATKSIRSRALTHRKDVSLEAFEALPVKAARVDIVQKEQQTVSVVGSFDYGELRVLHLRDSRSSHLLREGVRSQLAFLSLSQPALGLRQVCALPGPFNRHDEVHVAVRERQGDALWEVEIVPAHREIAAVVGFLQRGDQPALALMRQNMEQAVEMFAGKLADPVTAVVGLSLLLRLGQLERVRGWSRNLCSWFPALPDGGALHAAVLLRELHEAPDVAAWTQEFRSTVLGAARCGVPLLTDSLRRLRDAAAVLRDMEPQSEEVAAAAGWTDRMLRAADPDAAFTTLVLADEAEVTRSLFGMPVSKRPEPRSAPSPEPASAASPATAGKRGARVEQAHLKFAAVLQALEQSREELRELPGLAVARPGYTLSGGRAEPALVLAFHPPLPPVDVAAWSQRWKVPVRATVASAEEQLQGAGAPAFKSALQHLLQPEVEAFAPPRRGNYEPPSGPDAPELATITAKMEVTVCASPDAGWPVLRDFLREPLETELVVAMYDFTAKHVEDELTQALEQSDARCLLVLDAKAATGGLGGNGINGEDREEAKVVKRLRTALGERFEVAAASVGAGGAVPRAYHIKVAVADEQRLWLSSGNWQSSNQAPWDYTQPDEPPPFALRRYNRDYHVVVKNRALARCYAKFIRYDATLGGDFASALDVAPFLLLPAEQLEEDFAPARLFEPKTFSGKIKVTPLLTPDNFPGVVNGLLAKAKKRVWLQNQYIKPNEEGDNFAELEQLLEILGQLASKDGFDLRLCLRSPDEPYRDRLLAAGVAPSSIRRQSNCHAKLIIIDDKIVVVGSQNLSNLGFVANRDASLAFHHAGITAYFAEVFAADWERASPIADDDSFTVRVVDDAAVAPPGWVKVPWSDVFDTPPPAAAKGAAPVPEVTTPPATESLDLPMFGVDPDTGARLSFSSAAVAARLRGGTPLEVVEAERARLGRMLDTDSFGLPPGVDDQVLAETGWGVVWGASVSAGIKSALAPLLALRRREVGDAVLFQELDYRPGESVRQFLQRNGTDFGSVKPKSLPLYLLLVGTPEDIPFSFQTLLDVEYRVGRLDLGTPQAYARYAQSVVQLESGAAAARERVLHSFGPAHPGDRPTKLSMEVLVSAAASWLAEAAALTAKHQLSARMDAGDRATKGRLQDILRGAGGRPELLFTAGHGLACGAGSPRQLAEQGALVTAEWDTFGPIGADSRFAGADVPGDADLLGMVTFLFACYGAGTPATDNFPTRHGQVLAPAPFSSALPRALLSHPRGASLGVFGHIDRTLTWSLQPPQAPAATEPFSRAALHVLAGSRLGKALEDLNQRGASLASTVAAALQPGRAPMDDQVLVSEWTQQRDASTFVLLGDPAARLQR